MPLVLPAGVLPTPVVFDPVGGVLEAQRVTEFRFEMLSTDEAALGNMRGVQPGGGVEWKANAAIKGGGSMSVLDVGQGIDWLNTRIRPWAILTGTNADGSTLEVPCGVYIPTAPVEDWTEGGRSWNVELLDKNSILDQDVVTDEDNIPVTFTLPTGTIALEAVVNLITGAGESAAAIGVGDATESLNNPMTWDVGTSRLKIINDVLSAAGYFSLWVDGYGQYRATQYIVPSQRQPVYETNTPFSRGDNSLMDPSWTRDNDIYSVPNRYVAIGQGDGVTEAPVAIATNEDPLSPFSYQARGRWITHVVSGVEATSVSELVTRARMGLAQMSAVTSGFSVAHMFLPDIMVNSVVRFTNDLAELDVYCSVSSTSIPFDPAALCKSVLQEVVV
jgi:hypothetical protein